MTTQSKSLRLADELSASPYTRTTFQDVPIGAEFWWGGYTPERSNWGRKRSKRTADYRPRLSGNLASWSDWGYWRQGEVVFIASGDRREPEA